MMIVALLLTGCAGNIKDGVAYLEANKYAEAKEAFQKDIEKEKHLDEAYEGLGIACFELGEYDEALEAFDLALKNGAKETATICSFMGACYMETGEYEKSLDVYEKALADKKITDELKQEINYNLIVVYENMSNWDAAKKQMDKYVKSYPDDARVNKEAEFLESR